MRQIARLLLLWMIAVALPLQGVYAASAWRCGSAAHESLDATPASGVEAVHVHHHAVATMGAMAHGDADLGAEQAAPALGGDAHAGLHHSHGGATKAGCSVCASCCSSTAPPPVVAVVALGRVERQSVEGFVPSADVTFFTDGPERPPRSISG
jgi:hypothetical protein